MNINEHINEKDLVRIHREEVDDNDIQGIILRGSDTLVLLQYVCDFRLDGLMVLRRSDISEIEVSKTEKFQKERLISEGIFQKVNFNVDYPLNTWKEFFSYAKKLHHYFVVEEECLEIPEFTIGKILEINEENIKMRYFTGIGRWLDETETLYYDDITSCQIGNNYLNVYQRYFEEKNA